MSKAQFKTNEAHYEVVARVTQIPENRWENDSWDLSDSIADEEIPDDEIPQLDIQERWLNNYFPIKVKSNDLLGLNLHERFVCLQRAQLYCQQKWDAKTLQQFMVGSDVRVTEEEIEMLDFFKSRLTEPLVIIDLITYLINTKVVDDEMVQLDLCLIRWFLWKLIRK